MGLAGLDRRGRQGRSVLGVPRGCDRELVLLTGEGMRLNFDDGESVELTPPHDRHRFSGERALTAQLISGPPRTST